MKKSIKLIVITALIAALALFAFAACGGNGGNGGNTDDAGKITVTLDANCTDVTFSQTVKVTPSEAYGELPAIIETRTGYTFAGWSTKKDGSKLVTADAKVAETKGDHTLYAVWKGEQYNLTFDLQGGKIGDADTVPAAKITFGNIYGAMAIPNNPEKTGYKFVGWYLNAEGTGDKIDATSKVTTTGDRTLYAKWRESYKNYTFDEADMIEDWSQRNDTHFSFSIADVNGDKKLKVVNDGLSQDNAWLVLQRNLKAGQTVKFDVTVTGANDPGNVRYDFFCYGSTSAGDPMTSGNLGEAGNIGWYWGQGLRSTEKTAEWNNGVFTVTVNIKEDCFGVSINMVFGRTGSGSDVKDAELWKNTVFYIDNVVITDAPSV